MDEQKTELSNKIALEKSKTKLLIKREDIFEYFHAAIKKEPRQLISTLVKEVVLYNDKIEIHYNYTESKDPDGDDRRDFVFYECEKSFVIERTKFGC